MTCFSNEPLKAVELALAPPLSEECNAGFLRESGLLLVVVMSGRDDCSVRDEGLYDEPGSVASKCVNGGAQLFDVGAFAGWLDGVKPGGNVLLAVWGGRDGTARVVVDPTTGMEIEEPLCWRETAVANATPRLHQLLAAFGERAMFGDWCEENVQEFMLRVGTFVQGFVPPACRAAGD
ncbi:MAG: hypothetical protein HY825_16915 [Acidobacteria bacterium]|nr:hypothetical protein [Acidobacteriota bacterium]